MFEDKLEKADNEFGLFEILRCIREVYGIDSELEIVDDDRIGVIFTLRDEEHFMLVDEIVFNEELEIGDKIDLILDELRYAFELEDTPITELGKVIVEVFKEVEMQSNDIMEVSIVKEDTITANIMNASNGEHRLFYGFIEEDVTYENATRAGYEIAHKMLDNYWELNHSYGIKCWD